MRFGTPQAKLGSNVSVIRSFLFIATRGRFWPNVAGQNMRPTVPYTRFLATVADVSAVSRFLLLSPSWKTETKNSTRQR